MDFGQTVSNLSLCLSFILLPIICLIRALRITMCTLIYKLQRYEISLLLFYSSQSFVTDPPALGRGWRTRILPLALSRSILLILFRSCLVLFVGKNCKSRLALQCQVCVWFSGGRGGKLINYLPLFFVSFAKLKDNFLCIVLIGRE